MADQTASGPVPLLNQYKHGLLRRRVLQLLTGGAKIRKAPWFIHLIQLCLWVSPLLMYVPFLVVDTLKVWNPYYSSLVYAVCMGIYCLLLELLIQCVKYQKGWCTTSVSTSNQFDDEQEVTFSSCFDRSTIDFIFSQKRLHSLLLCPLAVGLLSFAGCYLLLPSIMLESLHVAGLVFVFVIGWYTQCSAHYTLSVSVPNEVATYRLTDPLELRFLMRPFYIVLVAAVFITVRVLVVNPTVYLQILYTVLCLLPLGWAIGFLPPLDALGLWLMEQVLIRLIGGSAMSTDFRLSVIFALSVCSIAIVSTLTDHILAVLLSTTFGFILSQDVFSNFNLVICSLLSGCPSVPHRFKSICDQVLHRTFLSFAGIDFRRSNTVKVHLIYFALEFLKGIILLSVSLIIVYFTFTASNSPQKDLASTILGGFVLGSFFLLQVSDALQRVYLFGVFRNPLFPWTCDNIAKFKSRRKFLRYFSMPRTIVTNYVLSLLLSSYVGLGLSSEASFAPPIWLGITTSRILRKIWQNPALAHLELSVVALLSFIIPSANTWFMIGLATQALIVGEIIGILNEFLQKLFFVGTLLISFITRRKQKTYTYLTIFIITGTILFLPLVVLTIFLSSVISTPLLPLFTLPVFTISFPRPKRFWPGLFNFGESYTKCEDSIYYKQCQTETVKAIHRSMAAGSISSQTGTQVLVRFDDRILISCVLETGNGFITMVLKGLELQETSCHTVEASRIDDIFDMAYHSSKCCQFSVNTHYGNVIQPRDSAIIKTYSDARNVLTGIIDQNYGLEKFSSNLLKSLTWVFFHHYMQYDQHTCSHSTSPTVKEEPINLNLTEGNVAHHHDSGLADYKRKDHVSYENPVNDSHMNDGIEDDVIPWSDSNSTVDSYSSVHPIGILPINSVRFLPADVDPEYQPISPPQSGIGPITSYKFSGKVEDIFVSPSEINLPSIPVSGSTARSDLVQRRNMGTSNKVHPQIHFDKPCQIPESWSRVPLPSKCVDELVNKFPADWLTFIKGTYSDGTSNQEPLKLSTDQEVQLITLVTVCFSLVDVPTTSSLEGNVRETNSFDIYQGFLGEFPFSTYLSWLTDDFQLQKLVLQAYRYAVKLLYDEASLGEIEDHSELVEYLESYDREFFIGTETEKEWEESVLNQVPNLFSIARDQKEGVYTAHVLTLQDQVIHIGEINSEAVKAVWADLSFELLFLTNDDEERYSIQAHPVTLRNLMIQSAAPPLGYCVYSSGLLKITSL